MPASWLRPSFPRAQDPSEPSGERWVLFVGENEEALERAAEGWIARHSELPVVSPPSSPPLPVAVHVLPPPGLVGERLLYVPRLDRAFVGGTAFSPTSSLYLLPALSQLASEGQNLVFVATAIESELARDVLDKRGLASRFRVEHVPGEASTTAAPPEELSFEEESGVSLLFHAGALLAKGKAGEAAEMLQRALAIAPSLAAAHYEVAKIQLRTDDLEGAIASLRRTVELVPEFASAWGNLGAALGELQDLDASIEALRRAVELDPMSHALHSNLGVALRDQGRLDEAEACLSRSLALEPEFVYGHYNLGHVLYLKGDFARAIAAFEKARSLDSSRSPRQALLLAITRLASGDEAGAHRDYREVFGRVEAPQKADLRAVAEWDLKQLSQRTGVTPALREAASLLRSLAS
jgi:tetratricopeptide (TPR) repeat protein